MKIHDQSNSRFEEKKQTKLFLLTILIYVAMWSEFWPNLRLWIELNSLLILSLCSLKFLEIFDFGVKVGSCKLEKCWNGGLVNRQEGIPIFRECPPQDLFPKKVKNTLLTLPKNKILPTNQYRTACASQGLLTHFPPYTKLLTLFPALGSVTVVAPKNARNAMVHLSCTLGSRAFDGTVGTTLKWLVILRFGSFVKTTVTFRF